MMLLNTPHAANFFPFGISLLVVALWLTIKGVSITAQREQPVGSC
jgi:hypothetical protein